jgi:hypothetical protein
MKVRRVVTCRSSEGKSIVDSDGTSPRGKAFDSTPGFEQFLLWATEPNSTISHAGPDPTPAVKSFHPVPGATRFMVITFPPDSVMADPGFNAAAAMKEALEQTPGIVDRFEKDCPGMHATDTIDYGVVLEGEIWLELDDGNLVHLRQHDTYVQNGTRHAWRNKGNAPATIAVVLIGANKRL